MTVVWITGLPSSGKSTLALRLRDRLCGDAVSAVVLDGDEVRDILGADAYDPAARDAFYRTLGRLAAMISTQGPVAIVAATAPARRHRAEVREHVRHFLEVFVDTPIAECAHRDSKGLYAAAGRGDVATLPGVGADYEAPVRPDVIARGGHDDTAVDAIVERLACIRRH